MTCCTHEKWYNLQFQYMQFNNKTGFNRRRKLLELQNLGENRLTTRDLFIHFENWMFVTDFGDGF